MDPDRPKHHGKYIALGIGVLVLFMSIAILSIDKNVVVQPAGKAPMSGITGADVAGISNAACKDSDAADVFVQGETSLGSINVKDSCHLDKVLEYYCGEKDGKEAILQKLVSCKGGCDTGACNDFCQDSDGGINLRERSIIVGRNPSGEFAYMEKCRDDKMLVEYFCSGASFVERQISCSCKEGACA